MAIKSQSDGLAKQDCPPSWPGFAVVLVMAVVPPILFVTVYQCRWLVLAAGALSWAAGVAIKFLAQRVVRRALRQSSPLHYAAWTGLNSAIPELAASYLAFALVAPLSIAETIAFGVAISSVEIAFVLVYGHFNLAREDRGELERLWCIGARKSFIVQNILLFDRTWALLSHVASRILLYVAYNTGDLIPIVISLIAFVLIDGAAVHGKRKKVNWFDPSIAVRFFAGTGVVILLEFAAVAVFWQ
jgi:hypothetical protein